MDKSAYINKIASYLPNSPINNEEMEDYIGLIGGKPSRVRSIVLRQNGIKTRYYGLDKEHKITHSNAQLAKEAVEGLFMNKAIPTDVTLLACGTSTPDQLLPSHASMVHGELGNFPMEIFSSAGVCLTSLQALKICYSNILAGLHEKAVCVASELTSPALVSKFYDPEYEVTHNSPDKDPYMAFEKDFMRFMLSDGAGAVLVQDHPEGDHPLKIEWIEMTSYANELPTCMFMASELQPDGCLKSWKEYTPEEIKERGVLVGKQDIRQLKKYIIRYWVDHIEAVLSKHKVKAEEIDYVIPHVSSMFFYEKLNDEIAARGIALTKEKWFTNLTSVGNIGSAAIYVALDELIRTKEIKQGHKILLLVPESGRFSYGTVLLSLSAGKQYG
jgi:putative 3-oxoacyl-(acyl carrier protein) synthase III